MNKRVFFDGALLGVELRNIDRSAFKTIVEFEESCINLRRSKLALCNSSKLAEKGWMQLDFLFSISSKYVDHFQLRFAQTRCWNSQIPNTGSIFTVPSNKYSYWSFEYQHWQKEAFSEIVSHPSLVKILSDRFGDVYYLYSIINLISFDNETAHSVQSFHRDHDDSNFLVLFIYWSVPPGSGTEFVCGSHLELEMREDSVIEKTHGPAGSAFLMDTLGIHRGGRPSGGRRCVSWLRFSDKPVNPASFYDGQVNFLKDYSEIINRQIL